MGKFLHFNNKSPFNNRKNDLGPTATGKKIVKRTSHFLQKKATQLTQQAYHFQQQQQQPSSSSSNYIQLLSSPSVISSSSSSSFISQQQPLTDHDRCRQAYETFLMTHDLGQKNWPKSWKESTTFEDGERMCLNPAQLQFQELLYEVVYTEHTYVDDLTLAYQIFAKDALTWSELPKSLRLIFDNLVQIIRLHLGLLQDLRARQRNQHPIVRTIADIFLNYAPRFLDYYSAYFINFEKANKVVVRSMASKTDPLGIYFKTRSHWPECRNLTLQSFLLKPVQRLMKYPLFFKSLSDSLAHLDPDRLIHLRTLHELKLVIQRIEVDKKESEEDRKLEDLASRIRGMPDNLCIPNRRLVYEGYLTLLPSTEKAPLMRSVTKDALGGQHYTYAPHPNVTRSQSSLSFTTKSKYLTNTNNNSKHSKKLLYVFLFNDMILCTKVRSKTRLMEDDYNQPSSHYGPTPHSLFKLTHEPGQLTFVDRSVARLIHPTHTTVDTNTSRLGSLRRSWSTTTHHHSTSHSTIHPLPTPTDYEEHPHQFICSIATRHITNYHFETTTPDEKKQWCTFMDQVLESHVQRPDWWSSQPSSTSLYTSQQSNPIASSMITASGLLHKKTLIPLHHDMDIDKPQHHSHSSLGSTSTSTSTSSNSSSSDHTEETGTIDMFTTAVSSPVTGVFHYQRSNSTDNVEQGIMDTY